MEDFQEDIDRRTYAMQYYCHNAGLAGVQTIQNLAVQDEQLQDIKRTLVSVDVALIDTKQNISRLKGITQQVIGSVRTKLYQKVFSKVFLHPTTKRNSSPVASPRTRSSSPMAIRSSVPSTKSFQEISNDEALDQIGHALQRLKGIALEINDQLDGQAETIKDIHEHIGRSTNAIEQQNTQMKKMFS